MADGFAQVHVPSRSNGLESAPLVDINASVVVAAIVLSRIDELAFALHVRGRTRRRILDECRDHLVDSAAEYGETEAVRAAGGDRGRLRRRIRHPAHPARDVPRRRGCAAHRRVPLALINSAVSGLTGPNAWTV